MSNDPSQGQVADPKHLHGHAVPEPNGTEIIRGIGAAVDRKNAETTKPRPPQQVGGRQDWKKG